MFGGNPEGFTDTEQRGNGYRSACFDLLPVARRKTESIHAFLRVAMPFSQLADPLPKCKEKFLLIHHDRGPCIATGKNGDIEMRSFPVRTVCQSLCSGIELTSQLRRKSGAPAFHDGGMPQFLDMGSPPPFKRAP